MFDCLNALGDHLQMETPGQRDHRGDNGGIAVVKRHVADEALVDLQSGHWKLPQIAKRTVAGAKVINPHRKALPTEFVQQPDGAGGVVDERAFG